MAKPPSLFGPERHEIDKRWLQRRFKHMGMKQLPNDVPSTEKVSIEHVGEYVLQFAILTQALEDSLAPFFVRSCKRLDRYQERAALADALQFDAKKWFSSRSVNFCSFLSVCYYLELDPEWVRERRDALENAFLKDSKYARARVRLENVFLYQASKVSTMRRRIYATLKRQDNRPLYDYLEQCYKGKEEENVRERRQTEGDKRDSSLL